jgi:hypothetical protein
VFRVDPYSPPSIQARNLSACIRATPTQETRSIISFVSNSVTTQSTHFAWICLLISNGLEDVGGAVRKYEERAEDESPLASTSVLSGREGWAGLVSGVFCLSFALLWELLQKGRKIGELSSLQLQEKVIAGWKQYIPRSHATYSHVPALNSIASAACMSRPLARSSSGPG